MSPTETRPGVVRTTKEGRKEEGRDKTQKEEGRRVRWYPLTPVQKTYPLSLTLQLLPLYFLISIVPKLKGRLFGSFSGPNTLDLCTFTTGTGMR